MPVENPLFFRSAPKMASMRESDTGLWLHNKLGSTDELWAPPSIASLLTASVIDNIRLCFHGLSSAVKLKLLLGMLHLPRRAVDEVSTVRGQREGRRRDTAVPVSSPPPAFFSSLFFRSVIRGAAAASRGLRAVGAGPEGGGRASRAALGRGGRVPLLLLAFWGGEEARSRPAEPAETRDAVWGLGVPSIKECSVGFAALLGIWLVLVF